MELSDFKDNPKDLIGKYVLIASRYRQEVKKITRVTKTAFGFDDTSDLFSLTNGFIKGGGNWNFTSAKLITEERANELRSIWDKEKRQRQLKEQLTEKLKSATLQQLEAINELLIKTNINEPNKY